MDSDCLDVHVQSHARYLELNVLADCDDLVANRSSLRLGTVSEPQRAAAGFLGRAHVVCVWIKVK